MAIASLDKEFLVHADADGCEADMIKDTMATRTDLLEKSVASAEKIQKGGEDA